MYDLHVEINWIVRGEITERAVFWKHSVKTETPQIGWNINFEGKSHVAIQLTVASICLGLNLNESENSNQIFLNVHCKDIDLLSKVAFDRIVKWLEENDFEKM